MQPHMDYERSKYTPQNETCAILTISRLIQTAKRLGATHVRQHQQLVIIVADEAALGQHRVTPCTVGVSMAGGGPGNTSLCRRQMWHPKWQQEAPHLNFNVGCTQTKLVVQHRVPHFEGELAHLSTHPAVAQSRNITWPPQSWPLQVSAVCLIPRGIIEHH